MTARIDATREVPLWIRSGDDDLMAVLTQPADPADVGVVLLAGGGWMPSPHRNRMFVDLARDLAELGCTVIRFDYRGVGNSTGDTKVFDSMNPHRADAVAVSAVLEDLGVERVILVGTCYGGRTALAAASQVSNLVGMVLSGVPVKDYGGADKGLGWHAKRAWSLETLKRLRTRYPKYLRILKASLRRLLPGNGPTRSDPVSRQYLDGLRGVLERGAKVLALEGSSDKHHPAFVQAMDGSLGELLKAHRGAFTVEELEGELHGELWPESQEFTRSRVLSFVEDYLNRS